MNNKRKEELIDNLTHREVYDNYENYKKYRITILVLILIVSLGLLAINKARKNENTKSKKVNKYTICKYDDCKTFSKDFINSVRYPNSDGTKAKNCGTSKTNIDVVLDACAASNNKSCSNFGDKKQYCYAFTKENTQLESNLELINPKTINEISYFTNLKFLHLYISANNYDIIGTLNQIGLINETNTELKTYIFIEDLSTIKKDNIDALSSTSSDRLYVCIGDETKCNSNGVYLSQDEFISIVNNFNEIKTNTDSLSNDLEKVAYIYSYVTKNINPSSNVVDDINDFNKENYQKTVVPGTLKGVVINKIASYLGYVSYFNELCNYLNIESNIVIATNNSNGYEYAWNQIKVDGKWYNIDVTLDAINYHNRKDNFEYFLLSDDEFNHKDTYTIDEKNKSITESYNRDKVNETIASLSLK